jgi:hypothetical protein
MHTCLTDIINKGTEQPDKEIKYFDGLSYDDLVSNLHKIHNNKQNEIYLYYNPEFIADYEKMTVLEERKFKQLVEDATFCGPKGQSGIKYLSHDAPKCMVNLLDRKAIKAEFSHELKILGTAARVLCYTLKPISNVAGPTILVACHFLIKGLHEAKDKRKTYNTDFISRFNIFHNPIKNQTITNELISKQQDKYIQPRIKAR